MNQVTGDHDYRMRLEAAIWQSEVHLNNVALCNAHLLDRQFYYGAHSDFGNAFGHAGGARRSGVPF